MSGLRTPALGAILLALCAATCAENLARNGRFENVDGEGMPENWAAKAWMPSTNGEATTKRLSPDGSRCLSIGIEEGAGIYGCFSRAIDVSSLTQRRLLFSCRYRTIGEVHAQAMVVCFAEDFMKAQWLTRPLGEEARSFWVSKTWTTSTWEAEILPGSEQVVVVFQVMSAGTLLVDDVVVRPSPDEIEISGLEVGRVAALPASRRTTFDLVSHTPGQTEVNITFTPLRKGRRAGRVTRQVKLEGDRPQEIDLRYTFAAAEAHEAKLEIVDAETGDMALFRRVDAPSLIDARMVSPAFRQTMMGSLPTPEVLVAGRIFAVPGILGQIGLHARLLGTGAEASEGEGIQRAEDGSFEVRLATEGLLMGDHEVRVEARIGARLAATTSLVLRRAHPSASEVTHDPACHLYVNGVRMLPMGIYYPMSTTDLDEVASAGFNLVVIPSRKAHMLLADAAAAAGVGMIVLSPETRKDFWLLREEKFGRHPALIGWETIQRPDAKLIHPEVMLALHQQLSEISPTHPVLTNLRHADSMPAYARATDIIIPWELPVPQFPISRIGDVVENAKRAGGGAKPVWALIQTAGNAWAWDKTLDEQVGGRMPTADEVRAMSYLALVHGADGLLFYAYRLAQNEKQRSFHLPVDAPALWDGIGGLVRELSSLGPVLAGDFERTLLPAAGDGLVHMARWRDGDETFIIAVNTADVNTITTFSLPDYIGTALELPFENRTISTDKPGHFGDVFRPHAVHVYAAKEA